MNSPITTSAPTTFPGYEPKAWVAQFDCDENRPRIAQVRDAYPDPLTKTDLLLDLVFFDHDGTRVGRTSPACGGPRGFEPACPASRWTPIDKPDFERLAGLRYAWGEHLHRRGGAHSTGAPGVA